MPAPFGLTGSGGDVTGTLAEINAFLASPGDVVYTAGTDTGPDAISILAGVNNPDPPTFNPLYGANAIPVMVQPPPAGYMPCVHGGRKYHLERFVSH